MMDDQTTVPQIALVTASKMPKPDKDTHLVVAALAAAGVSSAIVSWDSARDWSAIPLVVLRTPWDYWRRLDEFLAWIQEMDRVTHLVNPRSVVRWNSHKSYLLDLQNDGVDVVPTTVIHTSEDWQSFRKSGADGEVVVKPAVSAGAAGAMRGRVDDPALEAHAGALLQNGNLLVQPFVPDIAIRGEVSLVFFDGVFSHAVRKIPANGDYRVQDQHGGTVHDYDPDEREVELASKALAAAPARTAYARVDLVDWNGKPALMELELIEPELFLRRSPSAVSVFADGLCTILKARLRRTPPADPQ